MSSAPAVHKRGQAGFVEPGTPEWLAAVTPSKVAAILGVSRWESPFSLWHRMKGTLPPEEPKDIFDIGHDYEPAAANRWLRQNPGWKLSPGEVQFVHQNEVYGFPVVCTLDRRAVRGRGRRVVEFKTARHLEEWGDDFTDQAPEDYVAQCTAQMLFTGWRTSADLLVLGPYFNDHLYAIPYDREVAAWIAAECGRFYQSLAWDEPPALDDTVATYQTMRALHPEIAAGTAVQLDPVLALEYLEALTDQKAGEARVRGLKTRVLEVMGDTESAVVGELPIAKRAPHASGSVALNTSRKTTPDDIRFALGAA